MSQGQGDHGCVDASCDEITGKSKVTEKTFKCPQCYRGLSQPVPVSPNLLKCITRRITCPIQTVQDSWIFCKAGLSPPQLFPPSRRLLVMEWVWQPLRIEHGPGNAQGAIQCR